MLHAGRCGQRTLHMRFLSQPPISHPQVRNVPDAHWCAEGRGGQRQGARSAPDIAEQESHTASRVMRARGNATMNERVRETSALADRLPAHAVVGGAEPLRTRAIGCQHQFHPRRSALVDGRRGYVGLQLFERLAVEYGARP